jgi:hypothetical protein
MPVKEIRTPNGKLSGATTIEPQTIFPQGKFAWTIDKALETKGMKFKGLTSNLPTKSWAANSNLVRFLISVTKNPMLRARVGVGGGLYVLDPITPGGGGGSMWREYILQGKE